MSRKIDYLISTQGRSALSSLCSGLFFAKSRHMRYSALANQRIHVLEVGDFAQWSLNVKAATR